MIELITNINDKINGFVWGIPMMVLILGVGVYLTVACGFPQFRHFVHIMKNTLGKIFEKKETKEGSVSPFKAMCTALAASIGTGNIAGVSGAIAIGGPGAIFWMWISALLGMCTKFAEVTLAINFRERNKDGDWVGGPMYYITNGLGKSWKWLACLFAGLGALAAFGIGNMTQINTIAGTINSAIARFIPTTDSEKTIIAASVAIICALICAFVIIGGIQRLADVSSMLVPVMAVIYVAAALIVIIVNIGEVPAVLAAIVKGAFLGAGSVNDPNKQYHLEITFGENNNAEYILNLCKQFGVFLKIMETKDRVVLYIKEAEEISKFLALIGSNKGVLAFEDIRITKEIKNNVNRLVNCETANLNRVVNAAVDQINDIKLLKKLNKFEELPDYLKRVAHLRLENPDASLKTLGEMLEKPLGKSGVNHRLQKIHEIAEELRK